MISGDGDGDVRRRAVRSQRPDRRPRFRMRIIRRRIIFNIV